MDAGGVGGATLADVDDPVDDEFVDVLAFDGDGSTYSVTVCLGFAEPEHALRATAARTVLSVATSASARRKGMIRP
jgi:hypothetical protein